MPFRVTYFNQVQQTLLGGWSENFWHGSPDLAVVISRAEALKPIIDQLHGQEVVLQSVRISDAANFRDVTILPGAAVSTATVTGANTTDYVTTSALLKVKSVDNYVTRQWIRGVRDSAVGFDGAWKPGGTYLTDWKKFLAEIAAASNGWSLRVLDRAVPKKIIQAITGAGVVTVPGHGYADNAIVRISRVKGDVRANKVWRIQRIDADTFSLIGWVALAVPIPYQGSGTVRLQTFIYKAITEAVVVRATSHKTGRPFGLLGGRRRVRKT
jgi:hypothetical protein